MAKLDVRLKDLATGKLRIRTFSGDPARLLKLKKRILADRARHKPPDTAIHTPVPAGVSPGGFVASFQVVDPLVIEDD